MKENVVLRGKVYAGTFSRRFDKQRLQRSIHKNRSARARVPFRDPFLTRRLAEEKGSQTSTHSQRRRCRTHLHHSRGKPFRRRLAALFQITRRRFVQRI